MDSSTQEANDYSIIQQCNLLLRSAILMHPPVAKLLPDIAKQSAHKIQFAGSPTPSIPVNWRFAESIGVLKALEGLIINALLSRKFSLEPQDIIINVDHAQLFLASCILPRITFPNSSSPPITLSNFTAASALFPSFDIYNNSTTPYRSCAGNLYPTSDNRYFHLHSDLNPSIIQSALGLPENAEGDFGGEAHKPYQSRTQTMTSSELDVLANDKLKRSGTIVHSVEEYARTPHGIAEAETGLWEVKPVPNTHQKPCWWDPYPAGGAEKKDASRPLAGLKVLDFSRIIAAPTATRTLAEYGASVMRVTAPHLSDMGFLHVDMGWGKWNCSLDLRDEGDLEKVKGLLREADVVVYGYRPEVLDKFGVGVTGAMELCERREKGLVVLRLNCYGWEGEWKNRSGWQQISDACCGVSLEFGRAMLGRDEPVTPLLPNSDHCGGLAGGLGVISALMMRAEVGGSFVVDCSLNAYSQWLTGQIGTYPKGVWEKVWALHGKPEFRHYQPMQYLFPEGVRLLRENAPHLLNEEFFEKRKAEAMGCEIECVKPVLRFPQGLVKPGFQVSARTNGVDQPRWPDDLMVDKVV